MPQKKEMFSSKDIKILQHAVSIIPNLEYACFATKLAKRHLRFPVKSYTEMGKLFDIRTLPENIKARKLRKAHLKKIFQKVFFPIEDERDFLGKVLAALTWGDTVHYHEQYLEDPVRFSQYFYKKEN